MTDAPPQVDFADAYRRYAPGAFRRARQLLGSAAEADEVVHDVFLRLMEKPDQYRRQSALSTYLYSAVTHACLNHLRNRNVRLGLVERFVAPNAARHASATAETSAQLHSALRAMPEPLAEVAIYYYMDGLSHEEIAAILGCSRRQVGYHVSAIERWSVREELRACRI
jgi:RNA polymerase sigma-70 factor (ECF subfamily)